MTGLCAGALLGALGMGAFSRWAGSPPQVIVADPANKALREENVTLRQLQAIDREAQSLLREQIAGLAARNSELNRRLALLRGVLVPDGQAPDLGVADALLTPQAAEGHFSYRLLLARVPPAASANNLNGRVELWSLGRLGDQPQEIRIAQARLALLRLQTLAGTLALPVGFEPQRLRVVLHAQGRPTQAFEFAWQGLLNAGQSMTAATPLP